MGAVLSNADRTQIRRWYGASYIYQQKWPKLENAMNAIAALTDTNIDGTHGTQPDDSAVLMVQQWLTNLTSLEQAELALVPMMAVAIGGKDKAQLNAATNGLFGTRNIMRRYIGHISDVLCCKLVRDVFEGASVADDDEHETIQDHGF